MSGFYLVPLHSLKIIIIIIIEILISLIIRRALNNKYANELAAGNIDVTTGKEHNAFPILGKVSNVFCYFTEAYMILKFG
jgi:hypothetical protein